MAEEKRDDRSIDPAIRRSNDDGLEGRRCPMRFSWLLLSTLSLSCDVFYKRSMPFPPPVTFLKSSDDAAPVPRRHQTRTTATVFFLVSFSPSPRPASICKFSARQGQQRRELLPPALLPLEEEGRPRREGCCSAVACGCGVRVNITINPPLL